MKFCRWFPTVALALALVVGCADPAEKAINQVLDQAMEAVSRGEAEAFLAGFSPDYQDNFFPLEQARPRIAGRFQTAAPLSARVLRRSIEREGEAALVTQEFSLEGIIGGKPRHYQETEHVLLTRGSNGWRIKSGSRLYALLAGRVEEEDRIVEVLEQRSRALGRRDLEEYMAVVSPRYWDRGQGPEAVRGKVEDIFSGVERIQYQVLERRIYWEGDQAVVVQNFQLSAEFGGERQRMADRERLELKREDGRWRIIAGL